MYKDRVSIESEHGPFPDDLWEGLSMALNRCRRPSDKLLFPILVAHAKGLPDTGVGLSAFDGRGNERLFREIERAIFAANGVDAASVVDFFVGLRDNEPTVRMDLIRAIDRQILLPAKSAPAMTPAEFKAARQTLGLTQSQLGDILGLDPSTVRRYEMDPIRSTAKPPHPTVAKAMRWLLDGYRPPEWPDRR